MLIDSHKAFVWKVFQVHLKPVIDFRGELVEIFQANHSFTWRNFVLRDFMKLHLLIQSRLQIQQKSCRRSQSSRDATKWQNNVPLIFQDTNFGILILKGIGSPLHLFAFLPQKLWLWNFLTNIKYHYASSAENWVILNQGVGRIV